jgi:hypothetical protein
VAVVDDGYELGWTVWAESSSQPIYGWHFGFFDGDELLNLLNVGIADTVEAVISRLTVYYIRRIFPLLEAVSSVAAAARLASPVDEEWKVSVIHYDENAKSPISALRKQNGTN